MATVTIRNLPDDVVERIKRSAEVQGRSMESELRELLQQRYADRQAILDRIHRRWEERPKASEEEIEAWIQHGRP